jgi:uncharacterized protein (DUF433 family)
MCYSKFVRARAAQRRSSPRGIRLPEALVDAIQQLADERQQSWSATVADLLEEAIRMRRAPGIAFVDGATGRRAVIAGTAIEVWDVVMTFQEQGSDDKALAACYPWLSEMQLRAALSYYTLYPTEIDARIAREKAWTTERTRAELPFAAPKRNESTTPP